MEKRSRKRESGSGSKSRRSRSGGRFLPNLTQLRKAAKLLPDPEAWPEDVYSCTIEVGEREETIRFKRLMLQRGSRQAARWIFEGKILLRNRDIGESD